MGNQSSNKPVKDNKLYNVNYSDDREYDDFKHNFQPLKVRSNSLDRIHARREFINRPAVYKRKRVKPITVLKRDNFNDHFLREQAALTKFYELKYFHPNLDDKVFRNSFSYKNDIHYVNSSDYQPFKAPVSFNQANLIIPRDEYFKTISNKTSTLCIKQRLNQITLE